MNVCSDLSYFQVGKREGADSAGQEDRSVEQPTIEVCRALESFGFCLSQSENLMDQIESNDWPFEYVVAPFADRAEELGDTVGIRRMMRG
jgi:hypothetical protein